MNESPLIEISKATVWCGTTQVFKNFSLTIGISTFLTQRAGFTAASGAKTGAVTLILRSGSALNLNQHFHRLFLDGVYIFRGHRPILHRARRPSPDKLLKLLDSLSLRNRPAARMARLLIADRKHAI